MLTLKALHDFAEQVLRAEAMIRVECEVGV
jgi:hypothetical protein